MVSLAEVMLTTSKMLPSEASPIESIYIEPDFHTKKWLLYYTYNSNRNDISNHMDVLKNCLYLYSTNYENLITIAD